MMTCSRHVSRGVPAVVVVSGVVVVVDGCVVDGARVLVLYVVFVAVARVDVGAVVPVDVRMVVRVGE